MAFERTGFSAVLVHTFIFLCSFYSFSCAEIDSDICCLKSIKDSFEDPNDSLSTWDFKNQSKSDICDYFIGVTCSDDDQVLSIELGSRWLKGQLSQGIANCSSLQTLNLSNNYLSRDIPFYVFSMLPSLCKVDLSYNDFSGEIPASIGSLTGLSTLALNNNKLSGYIPSHIFSMLSSLIKLDLSYNKFSGEIPASVGNLTGLNILLLNDNEFTGEIPRQLGKLTLLTEFSVANNLLWGPVPVFSSNVDVGNKMSYLNNSGLCGGPLKPCDQFHQSFREGLIAGYVFSATSVIVVYVSYFVPWRQLKNARRKKAVGAVGPYNSYLRRKREKEKQKEENQMDKLHLDLPQKRYQSLLHLDLQEERFQKLTEDESLNRRMSLEELCDATDCFSAESIIGVGIIGIMYKARLHNGHFVAVKRLYDSQLFERQFHAEIRILEKYKHRNIVPLLWFCEEAERMERILVYQYMPNGRLSDFLSVTNGDSPLSWPVRVRIALGIARGLCWLHHNLHIVHFSICSECILLDQNFEPKIWNFSITKFINQDIGNEFGYEKMNVYNFGTVLLELVAGKRFNTRTGSFFGDDGSAIVTDRTCLSRSLSGFHKVIDKSLIGKGFDDEICTLLTIAYYCMQSLLDRRPSMLEVYIKMSNLWEGHEVGEDFEMPKKSEVASATSGGDEIVEIESM